ncbi:hypothetical protein KJ969_04820 [Patescibacteria group bacterium]|nr:hypothetical protein [Patescibacteria group bacterium]MBU1921809.1 hypothetical protein [Patescibacteria group bacterium]
MKKSLFMILSCFVIFSFVAMPCLAQEATEEYTSEVTSEVNFAGMLVEVGSTDLPTTLIIRPNAGGLDVTVNLDENVVLGQRRDQLTSLSDWIPGDQIRVIGLKDENTSVVDATIVINLSIQLYIHRGINGWIEAIDTETGIIDIQWMNTIHQIKITEDTHLVAGKKNPAEIKDLEIGDRVRGRLLKRVGEIPDAKILIVLRRGSDLFMKIRTWVTKGQLLEINGTEAPTTIKIQLLPSLLLKEGDVNNLIGSVGDEVEVDIGESTKIVRRFFGSSNLSEFLPGDNLVIVGRINDEGRIEAKLVKNNSIWLTATKGRAGVITSIDESGQMFVLEWGANSWNIYCTANTRFVDGAYGDVDFSALEVGDKIRGRGVKRFLSDDITATLVVIVPALE